MSQLSNIINILSSKKYIDKKLLNYIKSLNSDERKYYVFKTFYDNKDNQLMNSMEDIITCGNIGCTYLGVKLIDFMTKGKEFCGYKKELLYNRNNYFDVMEYYYSLLSKMSKLADELIFNNSLELSILFSYLMWNGYLSKNKYYNFDKYSRKNIYGLFFVDVIDGIGVCLNHSEFLKDFLNYCGYSSVCLINYYGSNIKMDKILKVKRNFASKVDDNDKLLHDIFKRKKENHVFNFIEDSGKCYIYDSTNFLLADILNLSSAEVLNGNGKFKLFPYDSYELCASKKEEQTIDRLFMSKEFDSLYSKEDFKFMSNICMTIIRGSKSLIEDFYDVARSDIIGISKETDKIMVKQKLR